MEKNSSKRKEKRNLFFQRRERKFNQTIKERNLLALLFVNTLELPYSIQFDKSKKMFCMYFQYQDTQFSFHLMPDELSLVKNTKAEVVGKTVWDGTTSQEQIIALEKILSNIDYINVNKK